MSNIENIEELKINLKDIIKSAKILIKDLKELHNIVNYIKLYENKGFNVENIMSILNGNIKNTEEYLVDIMKNMKVISKRIHDKTDLLKNDNICHKNHDIITNIVGNKKQYSDSENSSVTTDSSDNSGHKKKCCRCCKYCRCCKIKL